MGQPGTSRLYERDEHWMQNDFGPAGHSRVPDGIDGVSANDIAYNKVFPYAATPLNGRKHGHHGTAP